jgi:hypothetical protein
MIDLAFSGLFRLEVATALSIMAIMSTLIKQHQPK